MATLSSSIVKNHVASMREVEEALARQVIYGGDLVTNLLELAPVSEPALTVLLAESHGLDPAPAGELAPAPDHVRRLVPGELAQRNGFYPLGESDGVLEIAVSEPLPTEVEGDLSFSLGARVAQRAAPLVRIRQALSRDYGLPLDRRMLRLVAKLSGHPDPSPSSIPAPLRDGPIGFPKLPRPASVPPIGFPSATLPHDESGSAISPTLVHAPSAPALPREKPPSALPPAPPPAQPLPSTLITPRHPSERAETPAPISWLAPGPERERGKRKHRGPYTAAMAEHDLLDAESRDDVIAAFFDFASQYFEYSALFALQGDIAEGREAHGPGADRERIRAIGIPLDLPSALASAKNAKSFRLVTLGGEGIDAGLSKDLQREAGRVALVLPIVVRGRCVVLLYGDHGKGDVALEDVGDVIAFASLVSAALERVIMKKKLAARRAVAAETGTPMPLGELQRRRKSRFPPVGQRVEALARALDASQIPGHTPSSHAPSTKEDSPQAKTSAPSQPPSAASQGAPATVAASPRALSGPPTADESPQAKSEAPPTPGESPMAKARASMSPQPVLAVGEGKRKNTPRQGTPQAIDPGMGAEDQPFPLTRRTPSGRYVPVVTPPSSDRLEMVDAGWDEPTPAIPLSEAARRVTDAFEREPSLTSDVGHEAPLAPPSRQIAVGPRAPFPRQDPKDRHLPSVIVDVDADCKALVLRLLEGDMSAADRLIEIGDPAVSVLVAQFPGPIQPERQKRFADPELRASTAGPVLATIARVGAVAVPFLVVRTADRDPVVRRWATWLLGELPSADAARAVVRRFSDSDEDVRRAALAAGRLMQSDVEARTALRDGLATLAAEPSQPSDVRHGSIEALAALRDMRGVPRLIPLLTSDDNGIVRSVHWALCTLARQDFGHDAKTWYHWWHDNSDRSRIEWLIDALTHTSVEIRRAAGEELRTLTREPIDYREDLPLAERERVQHEYREWWDKKGAAAFS